MSNKIAAGSKNIVLDVKVGSGAFMKTPEDAEILAKEMVKIGKKCGRNISALLTDMDTPLGTAIGNSLEIIEAVKVLKGEVDNDLKHVSLALASELVSLIFRISYEEAEKRAIDALESKLAYNKMLEWIAAQGGDVKFIENTELFKKSDYSLEVVSEFDGYIESMDAEAIGISSVILGAGRTTKEDTIDYSAGIILSKKTGDFVKKGDLICTLYSDNQESLQSAKEKYLSALKFSDKKPLEKPLVLKIVR